jgi:hypothetical protein
MEPVSMNLDNWERNTKQARTARPQANMVIRVMPVRKPAVGGYFDAEDFVCLSIANNNTSTDILLPKHAWDELRRCKCVFGS